MRRITRLSSWSVAVLALGAITSVDAVAQRTRETATVCPAANADCLLAEWRRVERREELLQRMGISDGDIVADVGAGLGWYSLEVAKRVQPHGVVFAVDIQEEMLERLRERMKQEEIRNIYPVLGRLDDPLLPTGKIDWILLVDAYHEFSEPEEMLQRMKESLAPGGRVALLEFRAEQQMEGLLPFQMSPELRKHFMNIEDVMSEWTAAGFELEERGEFLPTQHVFVFKVAGDPVAGTWRGGQSIEGLSVGETRNVSSFGGDLLFAGQPTQEDFGRFREMEVATVINLRTEEEMGSLGFDEGKLVTDAGMKYVQAPMRSLPAQEQIDQVLDLMTQATAGDGKVLVHCASANRVGALWTEFRHARHGLPFEEALAEGRQIGLRSQALVTELRARRRDR